MVTNDRGIDMTQSVEFYAIGKWGFAEATASGHIGAPDDFLDPAHLGDPDFYANGFHMEELADGVYWVTSPSGYQAGFVITGNGVVAIDAPPTLGENILEAIKSVTDEPITHVIYSHFHADHIGAAAMYGHNVKIIAHDLTRETLTRFPDPLRPVPTDTFSTEETLQVGGVRLELAYRGEDHSPGNIYIYAPDQKVLTKIDIVSPGSVGCMQSEGMPTFVSSWLEAHDHILDYDFDALIGGHNTRWGTRTDVLEAREYWQDLQAASHEALVELTNNQDAVTEFTAPFREEFALVGEENWMNSLANYATEKTLTKVTSNGKTWPERLAGATPFTKYNASSIVGGLRREQTHNGYQRVGTGGPGFIY
jgi:glyoxylase-like metal-dependent hydrolase (beta-lactamase superfamily II)